MLTLDKRSDSLDKWKISLTHILIEVVRLKASAHDRCISCRAVSLCFVPRVLPFVAAATKVSMTLVKWTV